MKANFQILLKSLPQPAGVHYPQGSPFVSGMAHGNMRMELFAPNSSGLGREIQQPHTQDKLYVVQNDCFAFCLRDEKLQVQTGDVLFVPAVAPHRFEDFSPDFVTWVIFYGTEGGENAPNDETT